MNRYLALFFFSSISANAVLQLGLGVRELVSPNGLGYNRSFLIASGIFCASVLAWPVFTYALASTSLGFLEPFFLFPFTALICLILDRFFTSSADTGELKPPNSAASAFDGLAFGSAYLVLRYASNFIDAAVLSAGAACGFLTCSALLQAIRKRSEIETVPRSIRGAPLVLISAALLGMIATFVASALFVSLGTKR